MNRSPSLFLFVLVAGMVIIGGCQLQTLTPDPPILNPAGHLVINEVFTLPITNQTPYSWIEFYNPTADTIDLTGWTLRYSTVRLATAVTVGLDSLGNILTVSINTFPDSVGVFDVPFAEGVFDIPGEEEDTVKLVPGGLFTIVTDEDRLLDHIEWGPGDERFRRERQVIQGPLDSFTVIDSTDTLVTILATTKSYGFFFDTTEELVLKDPQGNVVDVVRYGNYVYPGPGADPYPNNISLGMLPEFQSVQRWAGAYFTANSANDFYVSSSSVVPTPQWYSLLHKR